MRLTTSQIVSKLELDDLGLNKTKAKKIIGALLTECKEAMKSTTYDNVNLPYLGTFKIKRNHSYGVCKRAELLHRLGHITLEHAQEFIKYVYDKETSPKRLYLISIQSERFRRLRMDGEFGNPYAVISEAEEQAHIENWRSFATVRRPDSTVGTDS